MRLEHRIEKLENAVRPKENVAESIRRACREMAAGNYTSSFQYVPGRSRIEDAIFGGDDQVERPKTTRIPE